jgi:8-oxo-dGTP pyrophosphatase MutT (NUDIX family)
MTKRTYHTVRCVLRNADRFLLVVHSNWQRVNRGRWGLPGGRIDWGEEPERTAHRELDEELGIRVPALIEVGDYPYKGALHRVYGGDFAGAITQFDDDELLEIGWHTLDDVVHLARNDKLHTGFELTAITDYLRVLGLDRNAPPVAQ